MMRVLCLIVAASSLATAAHADVVTDWNTAALNAIRAAKTTPPAASRALAILHLSIYDAVNGIDRSRDPYWSRARCLAARPSSGCRGRGP